MEKERNYCRLLSLFYPQTRLDKGLTDNKVLDLSKLTEVASNISKSV